MGPVRRLSSPAWAPNVFFNQVHCNAASAFKRAQGGIHERHAMIVAIEPTWTGTIHAPGNTTLLDIAKLAFPGQQLAIHAEAGHVQEVRSLLKAAASPTVRFHTIELSPDFRHKPHIVSFGRLFSEL